jgi:hypothetical protein
MVTALYGSTLFGDCLFGGEAEIAYYCLGPTLSITDRSHGLVNHSRTIGLNVPGGAALRNKSRSIGLKIPNRDL